MKNLQILCCSYSYYPVISANINILNHVDYQLTTQLQTIMGVQTNQDSRIQNHYCSCSIGSISGFDIYPFISLSISSPNIACTSTKFSNMANKTFSNQMILGGKSSSSSSSTSASPKNVL